MSSVEAIEKTERVAIMHGKYGPVVFDFTDELEGSWQMFVWNWRFYDVQEMEDDEVALYGEALNGNKKSARQFINIRNRLRAEYETFTIASPIAKRVTDIMYKDMRGE